MARFWRISSPQFVSRRPASGFTLLELLIGMAVVGVITAFALPNFTEMMRKARLNSLSSTFVASLNLARSEAVKRGKNVTVCRRNSSANSCGGDWMQGWIIHEGTYAAAPAAAILRTQDAPSGTSTTLSGGTSFANSITFAPSGRVAAAGTFTLCDSVIQKQVQITITLSGRFRTSEGTC
ncbi:MAG: GspH/FimT family pseudopilin [Magnetococcales bacterium]|nr:GspH/FimT family pseudopilin [Magnetococcales bacterium]